MSLQRRLTVGSDLLASSSSCSNNTEHFHLSPATLRPMTSHARIEGAAMHKRRSGDVRRAQRNYLPQIKPSGTGTSDDLNGDGEVNTPSNSDEEEGEDTDSDAYRQKRWAGQANILVTVRLRPHLSHDRDREEIVKVVGHKEVAVLTHSPGGLLNSPIARRQAGQPLQKPRHASASASVSGGPRGGRGREKRYAFDYVFTPRDGQHKVYSHTTKFLIHGVLNGYNATVFAYGCTGAGKTYTMFGTPEEPGIMARTLDDLFRNIKRVHADTKSRVHYRVSVSFLEVYNENIRDLLSVGAPCSSAASTSATEFLDLREDPVKGPVVAGISEVEASNAQEVMKLLRKGNKHRSQEATAANAVSSRSHAVLQVLVEQQEKTPHTVVRTSSLSANDDDVGLQEVSDGLDTTEIKLGKLSLVDLAGSERAAVTQNRGQRLLEGANINRSLLALGNCINALGEKGASFVPYRDSKLTRLLKDSLGGNCRTVMIANVSLAASSVEETLNTLKYANRAKNIKTTVRRNVVEVDQLLGMNQSTIVSDLRDEIASLKKALSLQQEQSRAGGQSPADERRWVEAQKERESSSGTASKSDSGGSSNNNEEEDQKCIKLREARQYIVSSFQERLQLRQALLKVEHQISVLQTETETRKRIEVAVPPTVNREPSTDSETESTVPTTEADFVPTDTNKQADVTSSALLQKIEKVDEAAKRAPSNSDIPTEAATCLDPSLVQQLPSLTQEREALVQRLARNETAMAEFRSGIEQNPLMGRNELVREILLMEYRIGDLEIDKMQLKTMQDFQAGALKRLESGNNDDFGTVEHGPKAASADDGGAKEEPSHLEMAKLSSTAVQPEITSRDSSRTQLPVIQPNGASTRLSGRGGLLGGLRDRLNSDKTNSHREGQEEAQTASPSPLTYRRHWGIHLNNTALPYIRLKKKNPVPLFVEPTTSIAATRGANAQISLALGKTAPTASVAAPYLKSLKNRRKSSRSSGQVASTMQKRHGFKFK